MFFTDKEGKAQTGTVWRVLGVGGMTGGQSSKDLAVTMLSGLTESEFIAKALATPAIKSDAKLIESVLQTRAFFASPEVTAKYNLVNGKYIPK